MTKQITNQIMMIRPVNFMLNKETAVNNYYQKEIDLEATLIQEKAESEFDAFSEKLKNEGVDVIVIEDTMEPQTPDSIFPNNWISFHSDGKNQIVPDVCGKQKAGNEERTF